MKNQKKALNTLALVTVLSFTMLSFGSTSKKPEVNDTVVDAITTGQMEKVSSLTKKGASIDSLSSDDQTGLMKVAGEGDKTTAEQLLKMGADLNKANTKGETALWYAVYSGHEELALSFIAKGAKADQILADSKECLVHFAAKAQLPKLSAKLAKLTPKCLSQKNVEGQTPSDIAKGFGDTKLASTLSPPKKK
ncbi:MAG: ankyrin repeat domain-containing protein [Bdellovibrionota bacterium]